MPRLTVIRFGRVSRLTGETGTKTPSPGEAPAPDALHIPCHESGAPKRLATHHDHRTGNLCAHPQDLRGRPLPRGSLREKVPDAICEANRVYEVQPVSHPAPELDGCGGVGTPEPLFVSGFDRVAVQGGLRNV